jgi:hypothetical protein
MIDATRRNILKMFGVGAAAAATGAVVATEADGVALYSREHPRPTPLEMAFQPPEGVTYNWKRVFVTQDFPDFKNIAAMIDAGWKPVPKARHGNLLPDDGSYWIEHGGLVLMEKLTRDCGQPVAHPAPAPLIEKTTGEVERVYKIVIP